jgi:hypothetical protein
MSDLDPQLATELDRIAPAAAVRAADWNAVQRRAQARRRMLAAGVAALVVVGAPALALSASVRSLVGLDDSVRPRFAAAHAVVATQLAGGRVATVWVGPSTRGGRCDFVTITGPGVVPQPMNGGGACTLGRVPRHAPLAWSLASGDPPVLHGQVAASGGVARVELRWHGGSLRARYAAGFFVAGAPMAADPGFASLPFDVVALDGAGRVVERSRIPTSFLYRDWKRVEPRLHRYRIAHGCDTTVVWRCRSR